jgi:hypothetical protein
MAGGFVFPEWLNANSVRAYPLSESATRIDELGYIKIPDSLIVSASITIHPDFASYVFFVSKLNITSETAQVTISCQGTSGTPEVVCTVTAKVDDGLNQVFEIVGSGNLSSITGNITLGDIQQAASEAMGNFNFTPELAPFEPTVVYVSLPALNYVTAYNGSRLVGTFDNVLALRAGENVRLTYVNNNTIRIDAIAGLNNPEDCTGKAPAPPCIKTINGIAPDSNGNFVINGGECIDIQPGNASITVSDTCSKSCCGCVELESLVTALSQLESQYQSLRDQINTVQTQQSQMISNLVANLAG